jgi:hypothetical protein
MISDRWQAKDKQDKALNIMRMIVLVPRESESSKFRDNERKN